MPRTTISGRVETKDSNMGIVSDYLDELERNKMEKLYVIASTERANGRKGLFANLVYTDYGKAKKVEDELNEMQGNYIYEVMQLKELYTREIENGKS